MTGVQTCALPISVRFHDFYPAGEYGHDSFSAPLDGATTSEKLICAKELLGEFLRRLSVLKLMPD